MNLVSLALRSLRFHARVNTALALGVAATTAVLTGALVVGDSMRGSLRHLALDRLGRIDSLLVVDHFFREQLAQELAAQPEFSQHFATAAPLWLLPSATVQTTSPGGDQGRRLASGVLLAGIDDSFADLQNPGLPRPVVPRDGIVINAALAAELGVRPGETLVVRFGKAQQIPAESPLGRRRDRTVALAEQKVAAVLPDEGLGRFSLVPTQVAPRVAYVSRHALAEALGVAGKVNALAVGVREGSEPVPSAVQQRLNDWLRPQLGDYGLALERVTLRFPPTPEGRVIYDYYSLHSDRLLMDEATEAAVAQAVEGLKAQPVLTYLANWIEKVPEHEGPVPVAGPGAASPAEAPGGPSPPSGIPYSTVSALDPAPGNPLCDAQGRPLPPLAEDEIVLTSWAADDLQAQVGDRVRLVYFEPETVHGQEVEHSAVFRVRAIVPLTEPQRGFGQRGGPVFTQPPTPANDPHLTPEVPGITDQASLADWDAPFPFDYRRVRRQDDLYWEHHRTTPKAYVGLAAGQKLWGSRFGKVTSWRIDAAGVSEEALTQRLRTAIRQRDDRLGMTFQPIRQQAVAAAQGTTPFDVLFLLMSGFLIAAALLLVWLLLRLAVEQRANQWGLLRAMGWSRRRTWQLALTEGGLMAAAGAAVGVAGGLGYGWLLLAGLRSWWVDAIASPFLMLYWTPRSLLLGATLGWLASVGTIALSLERLRWAVVRPLLAGEVVVAGTGRGTSRWHEARRHGWPGVWQRLHGLGTLGLAVGLAIAGGGLLLVAGSLGGEAQAGVLLSAAALLLAAGLVELHRRLTQWGRRAASACSLTLLHLALRNLSRQSTRSTATIALVACAVFLLVAVSAFRAQPTQEGVGGFDLLAESSEPIFHDLNTPAGRQALLGDAADHLAGCTVVALRLRSGDDVSCRNLYRSTQPRVLGVPRHSLPVLGDPHAPARFRFAASAARTPAERTNPWELLARRTPPGQPIPVILDQNTAMYSLRLYRGVGETFEVDYPEAPHTVFRVVGLLAGSVLQGNLLVGEADFIHLFPRLGGYRAFLIRTPSGQADAVARFLEDRLSDEGLDSVPATGRLAELLAVQNTYIRTFQSLGGLGLVLGTFGLAAVQLRSVLERRKELALLRAAGLRPGRLLAMLAWEQAALLAGGLGLGLACALVVALPQGMRGGAHLPWGDLAAVLGAVLLVGLGTALAAARAALRAPVVSTLRGE
jgi:ABC-type lipoprotein release transport system permease subunit